MYASVRGWVELGTKQRGAAEEIIERDRQDPYSNGWIFAAPFSWTQYLLYAGDIREAAVGWLRAQVVLLAGLPAIDDDGDRPAGFFLITDERDNTTTWHVRDGSLHEQPAPELSWLGR
jgi:hypothetical protein